MADYVITVYHDLRRPKENQVYPIKIRVYFKYKTRYYPTGHDLAEDHFKRSYLAEKPKNTKEVKFSDIKDEITAILTKAKEAAKELKKFSFEKFESKFLIKSGSGKDVFFHYSKIYKALIEEERIKTASGYDLSMKSLKEYLKHKIKPATDLSFETVTVKFLENYEKWMIDHGNTYTTIGIYLRNLRAVFNKAIREHDIDKELYPFGENKYVIPEGESSKRSFEKSDLKKLFTYELPAESPIIKARAFWFFSYMANGMNVRDICELKNSNFSNDRFTFIRTKTKRTTKKKIRPIEVILTPPLKQIIAEYGTKSKNPQQYVFQIFTYGMTATEKVRACQTITRYINQHMKKLAKLVGVDEEISTYYARHSYSNISVNEGNSLEFVQEALGHQSITTTQAYFSGFNEAKKKKNANSLMNFDE